MTKRNKLPPRDSWIEIKPGAKVALDATMISDLNNQTRLIREVRGNILARCFEIEYLLDQVICALLFPGPPDPQRDEIKGIFDEAFLKSTNTNFRTKITTLTNLREAMPHVQSFLPKDTADKLNRIRQIRNNFAHYPVVFRPKSSGSAQSLVPVLVTRASTLTIDKAFSEEWTAILRQLMQTLESALKKLQTLERRSGVPSPLGSD